RKERRERRMITIAQQIRELHDMTVAQLAARYEELHGRETRIKNKAFLRRQVAWKMQEREYGGLSERAMSRLEELIAEIELPLAPPEAQRPARTRKQPRAPLVGTTLIRQWRGQEIRVEVRDGGFEWDGVIYKSLSAVAKAITGANWNGRL